MEQPGQAAARLLDRSDHATCVHAAVRSPAGATGLAALAEGAGGRLRIGACDVGDDASVRAFAATVDGPVDVLINDAGVRPRPDELAGLDPAAMLGAMQVNAIGPVLCARALLPALRAASGAKVVNVSTALASLAGNVRGGVYGYRMSKAALNMATRSLAQDLRGDGVVVVAMNPGWVRTDMGGSDAPLSPETSAAGMLAVIEGLTLEQTGTFLDHRGETLAW